MNDELVPLLHSDVIKHIKPEQFLFFGFILLFSTINFFSGNSKFFLISRSSLFILVPFITNVFTETEVFMFVINSLLTIFFLQLLLKYWTIKDILIVTIPVAIICNTFLGIFVSILNENIYMNGSLSLVVSLSISLCYSAQGERQNFFNHLSVFPTELFYGVLVYILLCMRWPPTSFFAGILSIVVSIIELTYLPITSRLGLANSPLKSNNSFSWRSLFNQPRNFSDEERREETVPLRTPSLLDQLEISQPLSEVDQNRRLRALRAIEDRLASAANNL
ncbi:hypothetical protein TRFO_04648 [Tritrichomonas foetus]|uniref:Rhomboid-like protein n=1 Tax=Tritrichomonas foetus TaxID=1144522 RepID=A0A1J4KCC1_9EUKA|nr:hypothetical protein TRFO_04648 [Tritrichomonas foetus]|eukprot:OHT09073.1 hypothetical protein TRFO_04648 [Tritrichomonas foetus]